MKTWNVLAAAAIVAAAGLHSSARAADPTTAELAEEVKALRQEIANLKSQQQPPTTPTAAEAVKADADKRSFADGVTAITAGYDKGIFIRSEDGRFQIKPGLILQVRNNTTWRQDGKDDGNENDIQHGWEIRRVKPYLDGNLFGPDLTFKLQLANDRNASGVVLEDAWGQYAFNKQWAVRAGQFKSTVSWEEFGVSDVDQLTVERSLLNDLIGQNAINSRQQGVMVTYKGPQDLVRTSVTLSDGEGSINSDFRDMQPGRAKVGGFARVDYKFNGDWSDHSLLTAKGTKADTFVVGAGFGATDFDNATIYRGEVIGHLAFKRKWNVLAGVTGAMTDPRTGTPTRLDYGGLIQAGYLLNPMHEVFGRADVVFQDEDFVPTDEIVSEFTLGVHRYLGTDGAAGNNARVTVDLNYLPVGVPVDKTGLGYLANNGKNEVVLRLQFQLRI
jgi:hypothetical protein